MTGPGLEGVTERLRGICASLPGAREHDAWAGTSWRVGTFTFAHTLEIRDGRPAGYAGVFGTGGPVVVVTFQADADEGRALAASGRGFVLPPWRPGVVGLVVGEDTDWTELAELVTESHRLAPAARSRRRTG